MRGSALFTGRRRACRQKQSPCCSTTKAAFSDNLGTVGSLQRDSSPWVVRPVGGDVVSHGRVTEQPFPVPVGHGFLPTQGSSGMGEVLGKTMCHLNRRLDDKAHGVEGMMRLQRQLARWGQRYDSRGRRGRIRSVLVGESMPHFDHRVKCLGRVSALITFGRPAPVRSCAYCGPSCCYQHIPVGMGIMAEVRPEHLGEVLRIRSLHHPPRSRDREPCLADGRTLHERESAERKVFAKCFESTD